MIDGFVIGEFLGWATVGAVLVLVGLAAGLDARTAQGVVLIIIVREVMADIAETISRRRRRARFIQEMIDKGRIVEHG